MPVECVSTGYGGDRHARAVVPIDSNAIGLATFSLESSSKFMQLTLQEWLAQFDCADFIDGIFELCETVGFYIVDSGQRVLYWSAGMQKLTGLSAPAVLNQPAAPQFALSASVADDNAGMLKVRRKHGKPLKLYKRSRLFRTQAGDFAGGIGLLLPEPQLLPPTPPNLRTPENEASFHGIVSRSPAMKAVFQIIQNAAATEATVLVRGESGSGKELVARAIHELSPRRGAPFLAINCAALSSNLLESELFGHVRGAFTGAVRDHNGLFQRAHGGTLFLDEVAELPLQLQAKLLRVLQERNYIPVGGDRTVEVDVRIVAATHRSLREAVKNGRFREDLMYRLRVVPVFLPPLRERREDISLLLWHFIQLHNAALVRHIDKIDPQAMRLLLDYPWPGNVRELQNVVAYAFAVGRGTVLHAAELPPEFREAPQPMSIATPVQYASAETESAAIREVLKRYNGRITPAAAALGISRATFWRKRKLHGIQAP